MSTRQAKPSPDRPLVLWRTPGQTFRWAARSPLVAALSWVLAIALLAAGTWWQWPTIMQTYDRVTEAFQPDEPPYKPLALNVELEAAVVEQVNAFRSDLTRAVGAAGAMITAKSAAGVPADKIKPTQDALAAAQAMLDSNVRIAPPLQASLDALTAATTQLSGETPPPPPAPEPAPQPQRPAMPGGGGGNSGGGGSGGGGNTGGGGGGTVSTSASVTCNGGTVRVTFTASGTGNLSIGVSGPASGGGSGTGSASATVTGPGGTYTGTATGSGSLTIRGVCG